MAFDPRCWFSLAPVYSLYRSDHATITVLREDVLEAGSKMRFLPFVVGDAEEAVFGGPFCGAAPHALSCWARDAGKRCTLFYAKRRALHPRQIAAQRNGATIYWVDGGYMSVVQKRARDYADSVGALFLPLGFDVPRAIDPYTAFAERVRKERGSPAQVWCCCASGMVTRILGNAFPDSEVCGVTVGLASRHDKQAFPRNVRLFDSGENFAHETRFSAPFPSCANYDRKAWKVCAQQARGSVLFWNVAA